MTIRERLTTALKLAFSNFITEQQDRYPGLSRFLQPDFLQNIQLVPPKQAEHGDFSCTSAFILAKHPDSPFKNPRENAQKLLKALENIAEAKALLAKTEIAGPGFINLFIKPDQWLDDLHEILSLGAKGEAAKFLESNIGKGERVLVEYVSANPTGPLHVAHGRGAVIGQILAKLLQKAGFAVEQEYYINDLGHQIDVLGRSIYIRYQEELQAYTGSPYPEDFYPGEYVRDIAKQLVQEFGRQYLEQPESSYLDIFKERGTQYILTRIKDDLQAFGIVFDHYVSEKALNTRVDVYQFIDELTAKGYIYEQEQKKWLKSTAFGDDKDRVVIREDGRLTYFASDIAYHVDKLKRGFTRLLNIWGADHGGYVLRLKAALSALSYSPEQLEVVLVQMVSLSRGGTAVRMGKRLGTAVWLREVIDEAGKDATRYFFAMRRCDAQLDFDVELATKKSLDNPVYYAQMGYARMCAILRRAKEAKITLPPYDETQRKFLAHLTLPEELNILKYLGSLPTVISEAASKLEPHQVVYYLQDLIKEFHSYYTKYKNTEKVINPDPEKTLARLYLCLALKEIIKSLLDILGVEAKEEMYLDNPEELSEP